MGMRFSKRVNLGNGVALNIGKKSMGISAGGKGLRVGINTSGKLTRSAGIPGTGISFRSSTNLVDAGTNAPVSEGTVAIPAMQEDFSKVKACVHCGKKRGVFEVYSKYGFCEKCNTEGRASISDGLVALQLAFDTYNGLDIESLNSNKETNIKQLDSLLATIEYLEGLRGSYPFFKSSISDKTELFQKLRKALDD